MAKRSCHWLYFITHFLSLGGSCRYWRCGWSTTFTPDSGSQMLCPTCEYHLSPWSKWGNSGVPPTPRSTQGTARISRALGERSCASVLPAALKAAFLPWSGRATSDFHLWQQGFGEPLCSRGQILFFWNLRTWFAKIKWPSRVSKFLNEFELSHWSAFSSL